jgi:pimeloyl-ACP methyl ester carboxylesterase
MNIIKIDNQTISYLEKKSIGKKHPLLFIHGAGNTLHTWFNQFTLDIKDYYILAIDLPGHGRSEGSGFNEISKYSDFVFSFVQALKINSLALCGHSMGGAIALDFALRYPHILRGLILIGTGAKLRVAKEVLENTKKGYSYSYYAYSPKTDKSLIDLAEKEFTLTDPLVRYNDFLACDNFNVMENLKDIKTETLIIVGRDDQLTPVKYAEFLNREIKNSKIKIVDDAGHNVMWEKPDEVNLAIKDFLEEKNNGK